MDITNGYGYQWWINTGESDRTTYILAAGYGEQLMFIAPSYNIIIIFNCGYFDVPEVISPYQLINDYIAYSLFAN